MELFHLVNVLDIIGDHINLIKGRNIVFKRRCVINCVDVDGKRSRGRGNEVNNIKI